MSEVSASPHPGNTGDVTATVPTLPCRAEKCEINIHIGIFFDGTGNNQDWVEKASVNWRQGLANWWSDRKPNALTQLQQRSDSNVARLFRSFPDDPATGFFPLYVPGVGTPFPELGEPEPSGLGAGFGAGGDGRINYGLLHVLNSMYRAISVGNRRLISPETIKALCTEGMVGINPRTNEPYLTKEVQAALKPVGMDRKGGLLMSLNHKSHRETFFKAQFEQLSTKISSAPKPQLVEVFIDVFGFSRGAAQARTFCTWLDALFQGDRLAGVRAHIRFLGLFDTVSAVGFGASATSFTDGHQGWGDAPYLRVPARVRHCEHYAAMHENRSAFPLEDIRQEGVMPPRTRQFRFPGMHSDVGGGYSPLDQGRGPGKQDSEKLSQIPLNRMFEAAVAARVPLNKKLGRDQSGWDCYAIAPSLQKAYDAFVAANGAGGRRMKDCLMDYLTWRIRARDHFAQLPATLRASEDDRADLIGANSTLIKDYSDVQAAATIDKRLSAARQKRSLYNSNKREIEALTDEKERLESAMRSLSATAAEVVARANSWRQLTLAEHELFANYCHDSYAGFKPFDAPVVAGIDAPGTWEPEGYLRYRVRFEGNDTRLTQVPLQESALRSA